MSMLVVTSLTPRRVEMQAEAIATWAELGAPVVSLNAVEEIEGVRAAFPGVTVEAVEKSAAQTLGRPLVMLDSIWDYARARNIELLCILNSDLLLRDAARVRWLIDRPFDLLFGSRLDVAEKDAAEGEAYGLGFDFFFIRPRALEVYGPSRFCLGAPWWDFWVPFAALQEGRRVLLARDTPFAHVVHDPHLKVNWHVYLGLHFAQHLMDHWRKLRGPLGNEVRWHDGHEIFADFFYRRMRSLRDVLTGKTPVTPEMMELLGRELIGGYVNAVANFLRNRSEPV